MDAISDYWLDFWNTVEREGPSLQDICEHVLRDTPASLHSWVAAGAEELRKVASAMRGASGGDDWSGDELSCLPAGIWDIFARVSDRWLQSVAYLSRCCMLALFIWSKSIRCPMVACVLTMLVPLRC